MQPTPIASCWPTTPHSRAVWMITKGKYLAGRRELVVDHDTTGNGPGVVALDSSTLMPWRKRHTPSAAI
jgi:hypothetical protein